MVSYLKLIDQKTSFPRLRGKKQLYLYQHLSRDFSINMTQIGRDRTNMMIHSAVSLSPGNLIQCGRGDFIWGFKVNNRNIRKAAQTVGKTWAKGSDLNSNCRAIYQLHGPEQAS